MCGVGGIGGDDDVADWGGGSEGYVRGRYCVDERLREERRNVTSY